MIILMLFIQKNLRSKDTTDAPKWANILTIWSLMKMVNFSHDSMTRGGGGEWVQFQILKKNRSKYFLS